MDLDTFSHFSLQGPLVVTDHLHSVCCSVPEVLQVELSDVFGQGRLLWLIILDSCNMIQASAVARIPSLTKLLSLDIVFLT